MKIVRCVRICLLVIVGFFMFPLFISAQNSKYFNGEGSSMELLNGYYNKTNKTDSVQRTDLDGVNSSACSELAVDSRFTLTRTLCNIKASIGDYLQYAMYIGLTLATIFLIRNGFQIVTSSDREKQMSKFKKNLIYIIVGVVLLVSFYYIIDIFVSVVNLVAE